MKERRYQVLLTKSELDVITFCLLFVRKDVEEMQRDKLFGKDGKRNGAYHTINKVCDRAYDDVYGKGWDKGWEK